MKTLCILLIPTLLIISGCVESGPLGGFDRQIERLQWIPKAYDKTEANNAITHFKRATELYPQDGDNFIWLGVAYWTNGQYQEAIDVCKQSLSLPHTQSWESTIWNVLAQSQSELGRIDEAISSQKKVVGLAPDDTGSFVGLSAVYFQNKQYDEAITAAKMAIELKSDNAVAYNHLGAAYGMKKQYDEAIKALQKSIEILPKAPGNYTWMGRILMDKNAYNEAEKALKKGIEASPSEPTLHASLASAYCRMGRYDDAIASVNKAIELQTITGIGIDIAIESGCPVVKGVRDVSPAKNAGILAGDWIIKIDGKSTKGWNSEQVVQTLGGTSGTQVVLTIARRNARTGMWSNIDKTVTRETFTKEAALSFGLRSLVYRYKGGLEAVALQDAEKAYSLDSANDWARLSLGASYLDRGKNDEAIKLFSQVKDSPKARILEATAYAKQGKMKEAVNVYLSIPEEEISSKNIPLMNDRMALLQTFKPIVKEHRDKARSFEAKGQYKEALSELSEALKTADDTEVQDIQETIFSMIRRNPLLSEFSELPEDARKYVLRAELLVKEGNFEPAAAEYKKAIQIAPYAARLYYNSALINAELKKYPEAIRHMNIYLKAAPDAPDARAAKDEIYKWEFMMEKGK